MENKKLEKFSYKGNSLRVIADYYEKKAIYCTLDVCKILGLSTKESFKVYLNYKHDHDLIPLTVKSIEKVKRCLYFGDRFFVLDLIGNLKKLNPDGYAEIETWFAGVFEKMSQMVLINSAYTYRDEVKEKQKIKLNTKQMKKTEIRQISAGKYGNIAVFVDGERKLALYNTKHVFSILGYNDTAGMSAVNYLKKKNEKFICERYASGKKKFKNAFIDKDFVIALSKTRKMDDNKNVSAIMSVLQNAFVLVDKYLAGDTQSAPRVPVGGEVKPKENVSAHTNNAPVKQKSEDSIVHAEASIVSAKQSFTFESIDDYILLLKGCSDSFKEVVAKSILCSIDGVQYKIKRIETKVIETEI